MSFANLDGVVEIDTSNAELDKLRAETTKQASLVRMLKQSGGGSEEIQEAVKILKQLKERFSKLQAEEEADSDFDRELFDSVLLRRMIVVPAFEIYGGEKGLFDFGSEGSFLLDNILSVWKKHFVQRDRMLQLTASSLTPEAVFKASGHVDRFTDMMVKDVKTGVCYRADKLLEKHLEFLIANPTKSSFPKEELELLLRQADAISTQEMDKWIKEFNIRAPDSGNELSDSFPFNLMFATTIGPEGNRVGYLRPETAQGIFVNFKRLLERKGGKLPFSCAQIGSGFRNEISPRAGLLRVREFCMAEIEHFCDENDKSHPGFEKEKDVEVILLPRENQLGNGRSIKTTVGVALKHGIIQNETMAYFIARTQKFFLKIGIDSEKVRFRQHLKTQMAHYASDCWDGELLSSYGWVESCGLADRSCYDLKVHSASSGTELTAERKFSEPKLKNVAAVNWNKGLVGKTFKKEAGVLMKHFDSISESDPDSVMKLEETLKTEGKVTVTIDKVEFEISRDMVSFERVEKKVYSETFYPHVIEPSFGMGRVFYAVLEHAFEAREDSGSKAEVSRTLFKFKPLVAPIKAAVLPLQSKSEFIAKVEELRDLITEAVDITCESDTSAVSIGKRYARMDEIGVPFALTVDVETMEGKGPTLRERDSCEQIRVPEEDIVSVLAALTSQQKNWEEVCRDYEKISTN